MKKKILRNITLIITLALYISSSAQELWFKSGTTWIHTANYGDIGGGFIETVVEGEAVVDGVNCKRLSRRYEQFDGSTWSPLENGTLDDIYMYEEENGDKVYYYQNGQFMLIYDFTAAIGDLLTLPFNEEGPGTDGVHPSCTNTEVIITDKGEEIINGITLKYLEVDVTSNSNWLMTGKIYQKFGPINTYFYPRYNSGLCQFVVDEMNLAGEFRCFSDDTMSYTIDWITDTFSGNCFFPGQGTLSVEEFENENDYTIYPNPAKDRITINLHTNTENRTIQIINVLGAVVKESTMLQNRNISVSSLNSGVYFVKIEGINTVKRIVIK